MMEAVWPGERRIRDLRDHLEHWEEEEEDGREKNTRIVLDFSHERHFCRESCCIFTGGGQTMIPILADGGYALLQPFGLYFRQLPVPIPALKRDKRPVNQRSQLATGMTLIKSILLSIYLISFLHVSCYTKL